LTIMGSMVCRHNIVKSSIQHLKELQTSATIGSRDSNPKLEHDPSHLLGVKLAQHAKTKRSHGRISVLVLRQRKPYNNIVTLGSDHTFDKNMVGRPYNLLLDEGQ